MIRRLASTSDLRRYCRVRRGGAASSTSWICRAVAPSGWRCTASSIASRSSSRIRLVTLVLRGARGSVRAMLSPVFAQWKRMCAEPLRDMAPMLRLSGYLREERHLELVEAVAHSHRVVVHGEPHVPRGTRRMPAADPRPPGWQQELVEPFSRTDVTVRARRATRFERAGASAHRACGR